MFNIEGKKFTDLGAYPGVMAMMPIVKMVVVTPSATALADGTCRAIWASADTTISITDASGNELTGVPVKVGRNDLCASVIAAVASGTVWACY